MAKGFLLNLNLFERTYERFSTYRDVGVERTRTMKDIRVLIKGSITKAAATEHATLLQYHFQISPLAQTFSGKDRTFTFSHYTTTTDRNTQKHSEERKRIAKALRHKHTFLWNLFKQEMSIVE